jgi:hypothetical protein
LGDIMTKDIDMADSPDGATPADKTTTTSFADVAASNIKIIHKAVVTKEARLLVGRVLRQTAAVRSQLTEDALSEFIATTLEEASPVKTLLLSIIKDEVCTQILDLLLNRLRIIVQWCKEALTCSSK